MEKHVTLPLEEWEAIQEELKVLRAGTQRITIQNWPRPGHIEILYPDGTLDRLAEITKNVQTEAKRLGEMARESNAKLYAEVHKNEAIKNHWILKLFIKNDTPKNNPNRSTPDNRS